MHLTIVAYMVASFCALYNEMMGIHNMEFYKLAERFDLPEVAAVALMGSFARDEAGPFSDVDLVRFTFEDIDALPGNGSYLINGRLVVVSQITPKQVERGFTEPETAVEVIAGLRNGRGLIDKVGMFAAIQARARSFHWDDTLQRKANLWASKQMVGWIEEVHKGLEGIRRGDVGRLLNARFGCSWGLTRVMCVQRGVLLAGDNTLLAQVTHVMGSNSRWSQLCRQAFGIGQAYTLEEEVAAGLKLYVETAVHLQDHFHTAHAPLIQAAVERIEANIPSI